MRLPVLSIAFFILHFTPVMAADPVHGAGGMSNLVFNRPHAPAAPQPMKTLNYVRPGTEAPQKEDAKNSASDAVWEKYKALAAGENDNDKLQASAAPQPAPPSQPPAVEAPVTGFAAILQDYKKNKAQRSQMRTLSIGKESDLGSDKPAPSQEPNP